MNNILIVSYTFPPYPGIGGRRWAKFAKYLTQLGYVVHVIHAKNYFKENSLWYDDIKNNSAIKTYALPPKYPKILLTQPHTFLEKINYRLTLFFVKIFSKGSPYDRGFFWKKDMIHLASKLITDHKIKNAIVSCAPFSNGYNSLELKNKFPDLNLLIDLRDPWTWGQGYGFKSLPSEKFAFETTQEYNVIKNADYILVPTDEMSEHLQKKYEFAVQKIIDLPHAFDPDEIKINPKTEKNKNIKLLFYGTLYEGLNDTFDNIADGLNSFGSDILLDIYTDSDKYTSCFKKNNMLGKVVNYNKPLSPDKLFQKIQECDYVLIVQPDFAKDFITTKIYEIIFSKTPIILICNSGKLSSFIVDHKLGIWISPDRIKSGMEQLKVNNTFEIEQFPIQDYSFYHISKKLINYFKN